MLDQNRQVPKKDSENLCQVILYQCIISGHYVSGKLEFSLKYHSTIVIWTLEGALLGSENMNKY